MDHKAEKTFDACLSYPEMFFVLGKLSLSSKCFECEKYFNVWTINWMTF